ncbi:hypothetical protein RND71_019247 [Anisodus tanguticus]|uniref:Uncharacterized protein n=1 Tax=Anisodus tanguticus TaxID=243964 RepID=A0AAE1VH87_9SOLA|nr:hypothetical protein RND71_019247 [Anisodus tanguticus]
MQPNYSTHNDFYYLVQHWTQEYTSKLRISYAWGKLKWQWLRIETKHPTSLRYATLNVSIQIFRSYSSNIVFSKFTILLSVLQPATKQTRSTSSLKHLALESSLFSLVREINTKEQARHNCISSLYVLVRRTAVDSNVVLVDIAVDYEHELETVKTSSSAEHRYVLADSLQIWLMIISLALSFLDRMQSNKESERKKNSLEIPSNKFLTPWR